MKLLIFLLTLSIFSATGQNERLDSLIKDSITVHVSNRDDYSETFIERLFEWGVSNHFYLIKDSIRIGPPVNESGFFDTGLVIDKVYKFYGEKSSFKISLEVKRVNYSTLEYTITVDEKGEVKTFLGFVHGGFALFGSEIDEDDSEHVAYMCSEYYSGWPKKGECTLRIDSESYLRAKLILSESSEFPMGLYECPTLRLKE